MTKTVFRPGDLVMTFRSAYVQDRKFIMTLGWIDSDTTCIVVATGTPFDGGDQAFLVVGKRGKQALCGWLFSYNVRPV